MVTDQISAHAFPKSEERGLNLEKAETENQFYNVFFVDWIACCHVQWEKGVC